METTKRSYNCFKDDQTDFKQIPPNTDKSRYSNIIHAFLEHLTFTLHCWMKHKKNARKDFPL